MRQLKCTQQTLGKKPVRRQTGDVLTIQHYLSRLRLIESGNDIEQRCFTRAVRANQAGDRSGRDIKRDIINGLDTAKMHADILDRKHEITL